MDQMKPCFCWVGLLLGLSGVGLGRERPAPQWLEPKLRDGTLGGHSRDAAATPFWSSSTAAVAANPLSEPLNAGDDGDRNGYHGWQIRTMGAELV
ncbi:hypothetical protein V6N11_020308 [Hibiscus sabdariffa]|uniref:Uncharacterized protein n=1 Tax=Hibiscus sabdariffa TaxID=183260 RepID=A0ABR2Q8J5_9ROSI